MMLVVSALVINWMMIAFTHLKFRQAMLKSQQVTRFKSLYSPLSNYVCIGFIVMILVIMSLSQSMRMAVLLVPVWLALLILLYRFKYQKKPVVISKSIT